MKLFEGGWRNSHVFSEKKGIFVRAFSKAMYIQHVATDEIKILNPKLFSILKKYGECFDDEWNERGKCYVCVKEECRHKNTYIDYCHHTSDSTVFNEH